MRLLTSWECVILSARRFHAFKSQEGFLGVNRRAERITVMQYEKGTYTTIPHNFFLGLSNSEQVVLFWLFVHCDKNLECFPSLPTIALKSGLTERGVRKILRRLEAKKRINVLRRYHKKKKRYDPNRYSITFFKSGGNVVPQGGERSSELGGNVVPHNQTQYNQIQGTKIPPKEKIKKSLLALIKKHNFTDIPRIQEQCLEALALMFETNPSDFHARWKKFKEAKPENYAKIQSIHASFTSYII